MTSLIINMPHLQTSRQRYGAMLLSLLCWGWFLMPLVIVGGWLLGFHALAQEVVWLGGWRSLVHLAGNALGIIAALSAGWTLWTLLDMRRRPARPAPATPAVDAARAFGVDPGQIGAAIDARVTTVHFDPGGSITGIAPDPAAGRIPGRHRRLRRAG
jgi:poly-beta-1,6-N-acetyl-D-glucosamine biosynthesis protein PgaD